MLLRLLCCSVALIVRVLVATITIAAHLSSRHFGILQATFLHPLNACVSEGMPFFLAQRSAGKIPVSATPRVSLANHTCVFPLNRSAGAPMDHSILHHLDIAAGADGGDVFHRKQVSRSVPPSWLTSTVITCLTCHLVYVLKLLPRTMYPPLLTPIGSCSTGLVFCSTPQCLSISTSPNALAGGTPCTAPSNWPSTR